MARQRLTEHQQAALEQLAKPDRYFTWSNYPRIVDATGKSWGRLHINTAISFRWRDYARKDPATGWYVITEAGRKAIEGLPSVLVKPYSQ